MTLVLVIACIARKPKPKLGSAELHCTSRISPLKKRRLPICAMTCVECLSRSWVVVYVCCVCAQHCAQSSICAEVMYCSVRSLMAFVSRSIGSTNSFNCFWLYLNTVYQYEHVLLSTIYIRAFGGCIMAVWPVVFIEICSSDPTFLCS